MFFRVAAQGIAMKTTHRFLQATIVSCLAMAALLFGTGPSRAGFINYTRTNINITTLGAASSPYSLNMGTVPGVPAGLFGNSYASNPYLSSSYMSNPYMSSPYMSNPYLSNPYLSNPYLTSANPYATNPYLTNPYATNPYATNPYATNPYATNPYATNPYATNPYATNPYATNPYATNPYATNPYATNPYATNPYATNPYATNPYATNPYATNPYATNPYYPTTTTNPYGTTTPVSTTTPATTAASYNLQTPGSITYTALNNVLTQGITYLGAPPAATVTSLNAITNTGRLARMATAIGNGTATSWAAVLTIQ